MLGRQARIRRPRILGEGGLARRVGLGLRQPALGLGLRCGDARFLLIQVRPRVIEPLQFRGRLGLGLAQRRQLGRDARPAGLPLQRLRP